MMYRFKWLFCLLSVLLVCTISFCTSPVSGGGGFEGEARIICQVQYSDGSVASDAVVKIIDNSQWLEKIKRGESVVIDSTRTDQNGHFFVTDIPAHGFNVIISSDKEQLMIFGADTVFADSAREYFKVLKAHASLRGNIESEQVEKVYVYGTDLWGAVDDQSSFEIDRVPEGLFPLFIKESSSPGLSSYSFLRTVELTAGSNYILETETNRGGILVDDFELSEQQTQLGTVNGGTTWYSFYDSRDFGGNTTMEISVVPDDVSNSMKLSTTLRSGFEYPYAGVGLFLSNMRQYVDFSGFEKIEFDARGSGTLRVSLKTASGVFSDSVLAYGWVVETGSEWQRHSLDLNSISTFHVWGEYQPWDVYSLYVKMLEFEISDHHNEIDAPIEIFLDNIYVFGVPLENFSTQK
ncbi:hypothetical protein QA601_02935 [Chitinispirillales bacterium ANBcel5]|uniref:hypothetical protein n=1 Tax=Cellulosispirillum alkaliphilum TaxID=3039283 RepID=UPI002A52CDEE|nr:hypothetical protein [Chitinispirillales bacterium ANBcel5]